MTPHSSKAREALEALHEQLEVPALTGAARKRAEDRGCENPDCIEAGECCQEVCERIEDYCDPCLWCALLGSVLDAGRALPALSAAVERAERYECIDLPEMKAGLDNAESLIATAYDKARSVCSGLGMTKPEGDPFTSLALRDAVANIGDKVASLRSALAEAEHRWMDAAFGAGKWSFADLKASKEAGEPTRWKDS